MIGTYIRKNILPEGMSITEAARQLEVSRPTLSNLINGKSNLSFEMAKTIEEVFRKDTAIDLLGLQSKFKNEQKDKYRDPKKVSIYSPNPLLEIT